MSDHSKSAKSTADIAKDKIVTKSQEAYTLGKEAAASFAYLYPLQGAVYFATHPSLYQSVAPVIGKAILVAVAVTTGMFIFTYLPQVAFCVLFSGPLAFIAAAGLVLAESYAIIMFITRSFLLGKAEDKIFDAVLIQQGHEVLVAKGRQINSESGHNGVKTLGKVITQPLNRFSKEGIIRYLVSLPMNAIPGVGTAAFLMFNGIKAGPGFHARYFQLKGMTDSTRSAFVDNRKGAYTAFGAVALALNLVPIVGLLFSFTSTVGAALWASDLERKDRSGQSSTGTEAGLPKDSGVRRNARKAAEEVEVKVNL